MKKYTNKSLITKCAFREKRERNGFFMKKYMTYILIFLCIIVITPQVFADDEDLEEEINDTAWIYEQIEAASSNATDEPNINSRSAVVYDRTSGEVIWGKDEKSQRKMASTTKVMTSIVVIENVKDLSQTVTISNKAAGVGGSRLGLHTGDKITVNDLLYGLMLESGNDCAIALGEYVGNSVENFVGMMNEKANNLGLSNTHFVTVNGLDADEHYTTAVELAKLTDYALKNDKFKNIVGTKNYTVTINGYGKAIDNTNELLGYLDGVYGVKTGFTNGANRCLVTSVKRGNMDIISVVLGADTKKDRTRDSIEIIEYAYTNYKIVDVTQNIEKSFEEWKNKNRVKTIKGISKYVDIELGECDNKIIPIKNENIKDIEININSIKIVDAPINRGEKIGKLELKINNETRISIDIIIAEDVNKKDEKKYFFEILSNLKEYYKRAIIHTYEI